MKDKTETCGHPEERVIKSASRRLGKAFQRRRHLRRVSQDTKELTRVRETFDALSNMKAKSGKAIGWIPSDPPPQDHLVTPFLSSLILSDSSQPWVSSDWLPSIQGQHLPIDKSRRDKTSSHKNKRSRPHSILPARAHS